MATWGLRAGREGGSVVRRVSPWGWPWRRVARAPPWALREGTGRRGPAPGSGSRAGAEPPRCLRVSRAQALKCLLVHGQRGALDLAACSVGWLSVCLARGS